VRAGGEGARRDVDAEAPLEDLGQRGRAAAVLVAGLGQEGLGGLLERGEVVVVVLEEVGDLVVGGAVEDGEAVGGFLGARALSSRLSSVLVRRCWSVSRASCVLRKPS
jgi:hypothetical protein